MSDTFTQSWARAANQTNISQQQSDQWLRKIDLTLYDSSSGTTLHLTPSSANGVPIPDLRVVFQIRFATSQPAFNLLSARIYNLNPQTMAKAIAYKRVQLSAGYQTGHFGVIFDGTIAYFRRGKENPVDTYLEIIAGDGDAVNRAYTNTTYKAGQTYQQIAEDQVSKVVSQAGNQPLQTGTIDLGAGGKIKIMKQMVATASSKTTLRDIGNATNSDVWIDKGKVNIVNRAKYVPGQTAVLTPATGLVGMPEVTEDGIHARCLLNPNLVLGSLVEIKTKNLSGVAFMPGSNATVDANGNVSAPHPIPGAAQAVTDTEQGDIQWTSPSGTYKILLLEHSGDTRGNPWYSDMVCIAIDAQITSDIFDRVSDVPGLNDLSGLNEAQKQPLQPAGQATE